MSDRPMLLVEDVYKQYRYGTIGGGTLSRDLQSWWARIRQKEDPNAKIGEKSPADRDSFYALQGVSFSMQQGESVGLIGGNGAGKSTLLKLISEVTAPTAGRICLNGRVASMLEVGTGFHAELTGRENIYLNGAILGMSKAEIDAKLDEIIDFSECRPFIDTPVKRYSSGMYVKLAFSVAAHLDSEIMLMDEVLAVGDIAFQNKCIDKMLHIAESENRTILSVSHNMNSIRKLCSRCLVLEQGRLVFDGDVEQAIGIYLDRSDALVQNEIVFSPERHRSRASLDVQIDALRLFNESCVLDADGKLDLVLRFSAKKCIQNVHLRVIVSSMDGRAIGMTCSDTPVTFEAGVSEKRIALNLHALVTGRYRVKLVLYRLSALGTAGMLDSIEDAFYFDVPSSQNGYAARWNVHRWGNVAFDKFEFLD